MAQNKVVQAANKIHNDADAMEELIEFASCDDLLLLVKGLITIVRNYSSEMGNMSLALRQITHKPEDDDDAFSPS